MGKKKRFCLFGGIAAICVLSIVYLAFSLFFMGHYYFGTMIGEFDCGKMTAQEAEALITSRARDYVLTIKGREGAEAAVTGEEIGLRLELDGTLEQILARQNGFLWFFALTGGERYEIPGSVSYEEDLLDARMSEMLLLQRDNMREPVNARIGEYQNHGYEIIAEDKGTLIEKRKAKEAIVRAIETMSEELDLEEAGCYTEPEICRDNIEMVRFCNRLNRFVSSRIIYDWHGMEEIVDGDLIEQWLNIDTEKQIVTINSEAVREYVDSKSKKYDTFGMARLFRTSEGKEILLKPGSYGWRVDRAKEAGELAKLIRTGRESRREPEYLFTAAVKGEDDIGDSYVEIDLTAQHLYLYVDGELVTESDFVSGNEARGFSTPEGVYGLTYKTRDATLRGVGYATPVSYWMPFNGNVGMHDAKWRGSFGGKIYKTNGSHGCINLPLKAAEEIYEQVYKGFPVICYKETESEAADKKPDSETENGEESGQGTENAVQNGAEAGQEAGSAPQAGAEAGQGTGSAPQSGAEAGQGTENAAQSGAEAGQGTESVPQVGAEAGQEAESAAQNGAEAGQETGSTPQVGAEAGQEIGSTPQTGIETGQEAESAAQAGNA